MTAAWLAAALVAALLTTVIARQWDDETIRPRDAAATILVLWGVALATIAVIAIVEVQP
jgi:hypothetical protein